MMKNRVKKSAEWAALLIAIIVLGFSCSVKAPEVNITGEKTALENQVIGTYQEIEEEAWTLTSVRSTNPGQQAPVMSQEKKRVFEAVQGRKFNKDDIDEFKKSEFVGESNDGMLVIRDEEKLNADLDLKNRLTTIVEKENGYRKIIMERIVILNEQASEAGATSVGKIFARMNQDNSAEGTWIQLDDGNWVKKGSQK